MSSNSPDQPKAVSAGFRGRTDQRVEVGDPPAQIPWRPTRENWVPLITPESPPPPPPPEQPQQRDRPTGGEKIPPLNLSNTQLFTSEFLSGKWEVDINTTDKTNLKRRALLIAISYGYQGNPSRLGGTYSDAYSMIQLLMSQFRYSEDGICVLADVADEEGNENQKRYPSKANIMQAMRWLCAGSGEGHYRVLFFAGHGYRRKERIPNQVGSYRSLAYEGILPAGIKFKPYTKCEDCTCWIEATHAPPYQSNGKNVIPYPNQVLWGYEINGILGQELGNEAKLTVIFDCCNSGGILSRTFANPKDMMSHPKARSGQGSADVNMSEANAMLDGNFLGLPGRVRDNPQSGTYVEPAEPANGSQSQLEPAHSPSVLTPERRATYACNPHIETRPNVHEFPESCNVLCWAACWDYQSSFESHVDNRGYFTTAFVKHLEENASGATYRSLNRSLLAALEDPIHTGSGRIPSYQTPQLYVSNNIGNPDGQVNYFESLIDI